MNARDMVSVDEFRLGYEWIRQADLYHTAALDAAESKMKKEEAEDNIKVVRAEALKEIREHPSRFNLVKPTVDAVEAEVECHPAVREATKTLIRAKYDYDLHAALVSALDHKKRALEKLVDLQINGLLAEPKEPRPGLRGEALVRNAHDRNGGK